MEQTPNSTEDVKGVGHQPLVRRLSRSELEGLAVSLLECHDDVEALINDSHGVAGLHLNGDLSEWSELELGGQFEEWLRSVAIVRAIRDSFCETNAQDMP
jgi:hypothetical protein